MCMPWHKVKVQCGKPFKNWSNPLKKERKGYRKRKRFKKKKVKDIKKEKGYKKEKEREEKKWSPKCFQEAL